MDKQPVVFRAIRFALRYIRSGFHRGRYQAPLLPRLSVETTNLCNSKCVFCANPVMMRKKMALPMDLFIKAIDEFIAIGGTEIDFNVTIGDPLLDKQLLERARYVKQFQQIKANGFVTTLQWLHLYNIDDFFNAGFTWIGISLTLTGPKKYFEFFGVDLYDQMYKNLMTLITENNARGNPIQVLLDPKPNGQSDQEIFDHPDYQEIRNLMGPDLDNKVRERGYFVDDWIGAVQLPPFLRKRPLYPRMYRPCQLLYKGLMIYSNGNIGACSCRDFEASSELILGNISENSIKEAWNGSKLSEIRSKWLNKNEVPEICKSCRHYQY